MSDDAIVARVRETVASIRAVHPEIPAVGLILGSGLGAYAGTFEAATIIPYERIPKFPRSTVLGHSGKLVLGRIQGIPAAALQGRVHLYEGYTTADVTYPVRVLGSLGVRQLIVTNAAGSVNESFRPGDLMLITDHINLTGTNPLIGANVREWGERFPDMSDAYDAKMRELAGQAASEAGIKVRQGVYAGLTGPSYETPAEIRMLRTLGADAVGMSTVAEVIVANHMRIRVLGISCISNMAAGILRQRLTHQEVMDTTERVKQQFLALLDSTIPRLPALVSEPYTRGER